jgi:uncharacterized protein (DUF1499 family)
MRRMAGYLALGLLAALVAFALYVRLAPSDLARWHVAPVAEGQWDTVVVTGPNSASLRLARGYKIGLGNPIDMLARLDEVALATPRTTRIAGSVAEGRITWVTRSWLWGFPDYTTAEARADGLYVVARSRFGHGDLGVNAFRLGNWMFSL